MLVSLAVGLVSSHLRASSVVFMLWATVQNWITQVEASAPHSSSALDPATISAIGSVIASLATLITAAAALLARSARRPTRRHLTRAEREEMVRMLVEDLDDDELPSDEPPTAGETHA